MTFSVRNLPAPSLRIIFLAISCTLFAAGCTKVWYEIGEPEQVLKEAAHSDPDHDNGDVVFTIEEACDGCDGRKPPVFMWEERMILDFIPEEDIQEEEPPQDTTHPAFKENMFTPMVKEYRLAVGDSMQAAVTGELESIQHDVTVAPDGRLYYYLSKGIQAEGLTLDAVQKNLEENMTDVFLSPNITLIPEHMSNMTFAVLGRVKLPGLYPLDKNITLRQALGIAGGILTDPGLLDPSNGYANNLSLYGQGYAGAGRAGYSGVPDSLANLKESFIVRNGEILPVDFAKLIFTGDNTQDIIIKPGDYIYIAPNLKRDVFVIGAVSFPSAIQARSNLTLMSALAQVGGWLIGGPYGANWERVVVIRGDLSCPEAFLVNLRWIVEGKANNFYLEPGDIVYVCNKEFRFGRELVALAINTFLTSFTNIAGGFYADFKWFPAP